MAPIILRKGATILLVAAGMILSVVPESSAQNVGIGINTPTEKLHIYSGDVRIDDNIPFLIINSLAPGLNAGINIRSVDNSRASIYYDDYDTVFRMTTHPDGNRDDFTITPSGKIGIGTAQPADKPHIDYGNFRIRSYYPFMILQAMQEWSNAGLFFQYRDSARAYLYYSNEYDLLRMTTDTNGIRDDFSLDTAGNVGIGTAAPTEKLHIDYGNLRIRNHHPWIMLDGMQDLANTGMVFQRQYHTKAYFYYTNEFDQLRMTTDTTGVRADFAMNTAGNIGIGTNNPTTKLHVSGGDLQIDDDYSYLILNATNGGNGGIGFKENGSDAAWIFFRGANNLLRLSNSVGGSRNDIAIAMDGKVGIGTGAPVNKLHVFGGDAEIEDYYPYLFLNDTTVAGGGGKAGLSFQYNGENRAIFNYDIPGDYFKLSTDNSGIRNDFTVSSTGNIGIGLNNPEQKVHITGGDIQLDDSDYPFLILNQTVVGGNAGLSMKENGSGKAWIYYKGAEDVLCLSTSASGSRFDLSITPTGNIGIGTASPQEKLHVEGTIEVDQKIQANDAGGLEFATDEGTTRIYIADDGDVGIGTSSPSSGSRLHVSGGDLTVEDTFPFIYLNSTLATGNSGIALQQTGTYKGWFSYSDALDVLRITTEPAGGRNDFAISSTGKVGIGTASPGTHQLSVNSNNTGAGGSTGYFENTHANGIALVVENSSSAASDNVLLVTSQGNTGNLVSFDSWHGSGTWDREFRFENNGDGRCDGSWYGGGADYAEFFPKADETAEFEPGDVIAMSPGDGYLVEKAIGHQNQLVLGVYSTKPVVVGNSSAEGDPENAVLVGLMGVVPTKVCLENGPIQVGDFITVSSTRGIAAKAISSGMVIGRAMENYDSPGQGMIKVMVNVYYVNMENDPEMEALKAELREIKAALSITSR